MYPRYSRSRTPDPRSRTPNRRSRTPDTLRASHFLPSIVFDGIASSASDLSQAVSLSPNSSSSQPNPRAWSYYHRTCVTRAPAPLPVDMQPEPAKSMMNKPRRALPLTPKDGGRPDVSQFLDRNKVFLESYVINNVHLKEIERWLIKKRSRLQLSIQPAPNTQDTKDREDARKKEAVMELLRTLATAADENHVVWELARTVAGSVGAEAYRVFKIFEEHPNFVKLLDKGLNNDTSNQISLVWVDAAEVPLVLEAAKRGRAWRVTRDEVPNFPETPSKLFGKKQANHIIYQSILTPAGNTAYVFEMWRVNIRFQEIDEQTCSKFQISGSLAIYYCNLYLDKNRQMKLSDFLLDVVKAIFEKMVSLDQLIKRILEFAQKLVNADRASLFLVDYRNFELVSTVFDLKFEPGQSRDVEKKEIRMPISRGIAGHVALSGETMNIPDAYSDYRFNREVDEATGYKTLSILCMPIKVQGKVIGVVQMVNKRNANSFLREDEVSFEIFSTFFGLALHHARLYDRIMRKEQKYKVALEVLSYHNTCKENEVSTLLGDKENINFNWNDFYLDPFKFNEYKKCKGVIVMFSDLFDMSEFDIMTVTRFILTVKKNYRTVPYHNFDHGWSVAHSMYAILKNDTRMRFSYKMRLALFVASLCHDLDHRGYTNKYMSETASPLAAMYSTSTLEHHHFNITVTILQQEGHNIFSRMSSEEYKDILSLIRQCILATDLAAFFPNMAKMKELLNGSHSLFSWSNNSHRELAMAISMTSADLSASAKPWDIQIKTVKVIFEEFYDQGDKEREAGRIPIPMMDRNRPDQRPASQVGFLSQICVPCYNILYKILPKTKPLYIMALKNLYNWKRADDLTKDVNEEVFCEDSLEEVSDDVVLDDIPEIIETSSDDEETEVDENYALHDVNRSILPDEDEDNTTTEKEEVVGGKLQKDIEGITWIDEEGVVLRTNRWLKETANSDQSKKLI